MATPLSDESKRLLRLLDDGEWHSLDLIRAKLVDSVAPGKAIRKYDERSVAWHANHGERVGPELSDFEKAQSGAKTLARLALKSMTKRYAEVKEDGEGVAQIRLRPGVDLSSFLPPRLETAEASPFELADPVTEPPVKPVSEPLPAEKTGDELPPPLRRQPAVAARPVPAAPPGEKPRQGIAQRAEDHVAFFTESQLREIVREEIQEALDAFQRGMQNWLIHRFAALETMYQGLSRSPEVKYRNRQERRAADRRQW